MLQVGKTGQKGGTEEKTKLSQQPTPKTLLSPYLWGWQSSNQLGFQTLQDLRGQGEGSEVGAGIPELRGSRDLQAPWDSLGPPATVTGRAREAGPAAKMKGVPPLLPALPRVSDGLTATPHPRSQALSLCQPVAMQLWPPAPSPPEELAEGLVVGQRVVVGLREQIVHVVQAPLGHELP